MSTAGTWRAAGREVLALDQAVYDAVHATRTPTLDHAIARLSRSADRSLLWVGIASGLAVLGERPRRAAVWGLGSIAVTSTVVNVAVKPVFRRRRPVRHGTVRTHVVRIPGSTSYPSGHAASAFAFSTAVGGTLPQLDSALRLVATAVAYSRVHTGVHYPGDVIAGSAIGAGVGTVVRHLTQPRRGGGGPGAALG